MALFRKQNICAYLIWPCCNPLNSPCSCLSVALNGQICSSSSPLLYPVWPRPLLLKRSLCLVMCTTHSIPNPDTVGCSNPFTLQSAKQHNNFILFWVPGPIWAARDSCCAAALILPPIGFARDYLREIRLMWHPGLEHAVAEAVVVYGNATANPQYVALYITQRVNFRASYFLDWLYL